ncbi:MAG: deoxyribodipyrimidine photo-lyase [Vicingaceae bacterium]|nr:deoxyribodipyrimidine photo-lyase [Vicingaceae bacterium]
MVNEIDIVWLRRDLRLNDNSALSEALKSRGPVLLLFIFDTNIIEELNKNDARISFIYNTLKGLNNRLIEHNSSLMVLKGDPLEVFKKLSFEYTIKSVYWNKDYESYATLRDNEVTKYFNENNVDTYSFKDHVIFEENEILKDDGKPYTIFTPYSKKWKKALTKTMISEVPCNISKANLLTHTFDFPTIGELGFEASTIQVPNYSLDNLENYNEWRDIPSKNGTSKLSVHLRFGTVSTRRMVNNALKIGEQFLNELIWREFFIQIMWHFPHSSLENFKSKYNNIKWRNNEEEFEKWCSGKTGYPIVDAGMRELNTTGLMHNRVRMITASFLCKHLLIDWRWGEAYFAEKLLDYDLAINVGNWQWVAGTGCDSAPYFRVFNPTAQTERFDSKLEYIKKWVPEFMELDYCLPMVEHKFARNRALETYKKGLTE